MYFLSGISRKCLRMETAFESAFEISPRAILIVKDYGMAIFITDNKFHLFDPHSRNDQGYLDPDGHAVLVTFQTINDLCAHLRKLTSTLTKESLENVPFEITHIVVFTVTKPYL